MSTKSPPPAQGPRLRWTRNLRWPLAVAAIGACLGAATIVGLRAAANGQRETSTAQGGARVAPSIDESMEARRLALFRAEAAYEAAPGERTALAYANALMAAGRNDDVRRFLTAERSAVLDDGAREALMLEAEFRIGDVAAAKARAAALAEGPYAAYAALVDARLIYAADAGQGAAAAERLRPAFGGGAAVEREAWLLRARIALDEGEEDFARAAARRAKDAGASEARVDAIAIEADIRAGRLDAALSMLGQRTGAAGDIDIDARRLSGLVALKQGRPRDAAQAFDSIAFALEQTPRGDLLRALAKLAGSDRATAARLLDNSLRRAPADWVARDVAVLLAAARWLSDPAAGRTPLEETLTALSAVAPRLGATRRIALARAEGDDWAAFEWMRAAADAETGEGPSVDAPETAIAFLLGEGAPQGIDDPLWPKAEDLAAVRRLVDAGEAAARIEPTALAGEIVGSAVDLAIRAEALLRAGKAAAAVRLFSLSADRDPGAASAARGVWRAASAAGQPEAALPALRRAARLNPANVDVRLDLASALEALSDIDGAVLALSPVAADVAQRPDAAATYIELLAAAGKSAALVDFARAVDLSGDPMLAATGFAAGGAPELAANAYRAALGRNPGDGAAAAGYLSAMTALGRRKAAERFLSRLAPARSPANGGRLEGMVTPSPYDPPELRGQADGEASLETDSGNHRDSAQTGRVRAW